MYKKLFILILLFAPCLQGFSQIEISSSHKKFDKESRPAIVVSMANGVDDRDVEKSWKKLMKDFNPDDLKTGKVIFADNAKIPSVSANSLDIYARVESGKEKVTLYVAVNLGATNLSSDNPEKLTAMKSIVKDFATSQVSAVFKEQIEEQEDVKKDIEKAISAAKDDKEHMQKKIESYREKIEDYKREIEELNTTLETKNKELEQIGQKLEELQKEASKYD